ncbi:flagellar basal body-associated FliL family protein [Gallaecimonas xiamenensis]|uniref:Flagellar protein FliL n=1 Tax=Gallaecimonas xiamenensis 3-C-1 TaxID=745411 RepID=K2K9K1_9GAMM|nr:flagellar basal body-associated FliL family protein [Gallaecimonas xiamenensis]EKE73990.1 LafF [Gallaecimonas xiamenensis 3-C-1]
MPIATPQEKSKSRLPWLVGGTLLLALACGATYLMATDKLDVEQLFQEPPAPPVVMSTQPLFHPLDKFVVSLGGDDVQHYMMLELALVSKDPRMPRQSTELSPVIRNALLKYFSTRKYEQVRTEIRDMASLQAALKKQLMETVDSYGYELSVDEVLLTKVVIQ